MTNNQFGYPITDIDCTKQGFPEVPDMLFGDSSEGATYFDATALLRKRDLIDKHVQIFVESYNPIVNRWLKEGLAIKAPIAVFNEKDGHICLHESCKFLFLAYIDKNFALHIHSQLERLFTAGVAYSDAYIAQLAYFQLTPEVLAQLSNGDEENAE